MPLRRLNNNKLDGIYYSTPNSTDLPHCNNYFTMDIQDYETALKRCGTNLFALVLLSAVMLEIHLLISPVRDLHFITAKEGRSSLLFA